MNKCVRYTQHDALSMLPFALNKRDATSYLEGADARIQRNPQLSGLACLRCGAHYPLALVHTGCARCASLGVHVSLRASYRTQPEVPRYLPYTYEVSLGEGNTPLTASQALAQFLGVAQLYIKDESCNPTGSHKDRMSAIGIAQALDFGAHTVVLASSGNAAISAARYADAAGLACEVATYEGMSTSYADKLDEYGAQRFSFADNAGRWAFVAQRAKQPGYFALTNYHMPALGSAPLAVEGYKAIAYECHASGCVPEHIMVPTARGDLAWGIYTGFADLVQAKMIQALPKIWIVEPFARLSYVLGGASMHSDYPGYTEQFSTAGATVTYLQWQAATASKGGAVVVPDVLARQARKLLTQQGYSAELCAASGLAGAQLLRQQCAIAAHEQVLLVLTANASRDPSWPDPA
jgi:threonine synthase